MAKKRRLLWQLFPTYLLITLAGLLAVGWYAFKSLEEFYYARIKEDLEARSQLVALQVAENFTRENARALDAFCKEAGKRSSTRISLILPSGEVLGDSHEDPARMDNHSDRPEFRTALAGGTGTAIRLSRTLQEKLMYLAVPLLRNGRVTGVVRTSIPVTFIDRVLKSLQVRIALGGLTISLLAAWISLLASRKISRPLEEMRQGAERFSRGDLSGKIPVADSLEIGGLAEALNQMALQLDEKIQAVTSQRRQQEAVLSSMVEGVLAVDAEEHLLSLNAAGAGLLDVDCPAVQGRPIHAFIKNTQLLEFIGGALSCESQVEDDIVLRSQGKEIFLQAHGTVLRDTGKNRIGALIVLNDVTRLRRLENIRREFVANVSHELKTPITSIKGWVETLLDGAMDNPREARRFLEIIARQAERLNAIIEDLLSLSRLEQEADKSGIPLRECELRHVIQEAILDCRDKAGEKNVTIDVLGNTGTRATINPPLLEQALVNLIDNAIKYSEPGSTVQVRVDENGGELAVSVRDEGCGIPREHLARLFERFYRVDKARSRQLGGTGLGLAIVKHIAQAHRGRVSVDSLPGKGSLFSIHLPRAGLN